MYLKINNIVFNQDKIEFIRYDTEKYRLFVCLNRDTLEFTIPYFKTLDEEKKKEEFDVLNVFILDNLFRRNIEIDLDEWNLQTMEHKKNKRALNE